MKRTTIEANGLKFSALVAGGSGPLVIMCHGFPELAWSWRRQIPAVAAAGFRVVAPDMRGYGDTGGPDEREAYSIFHLTGDVVALTEAMGEKEAILVGHDWGASVVWHAALFRPDMFRGVCAMSVPFQVRRPGKRPTEVYRAVSASKGLGDFYWVAFTDEGRAERELEADVRRSMLAIFGGIAGKDVKADRWQLFADEQGRLLQLHSPRPLPAWISEEEFAPFVSAFEKKGFRRPIHWYRNIDDNWERCAPWLGAGVRIPALFITGEKDPVRGFAGSGEENLEKYVPDLRGKVVIPGAGHWVQQERPQEVNDHLLAFLKSL
ncbi:alpha/beta fold hydrolase [Camelimonas abortus]|uniref:Alpha/beta fold hydrolase n=1 Tax=Camelimonas abortus TaxID=1017184 RepID=A0ABV7LB89_9HYPH